MTKRATNRTRKATNQSRVEHEERPKRIPVHERKRNIMSVSGVDTDRYVTRWVNDIEDRIRIFEDGGWTKVEEDVEVGERTVDSSDSSQSFVTKYVGANVTAYLMKIPREWYNEDQAAKEKRLKEKEEALHGRNKDLEGGYGSVSVSVK